MERWIASILALCMILCAVPTVVFAEKTAAASGTWGDNLNWTLAEDGTLTISGEGEMADALYSDYPWYEFKSDVKTVVIGSGVTYVSQMAFREYENLTGAVLGEDVTSIGADAFAHCTALADITIPDGLQIFGSGCLRA